MGRSAGQGHGQAAPNYHAASQQPSIASWKSGVFKSAKALQKMAEVHIGVPSQTLV